MNEVKATEKIIVIPTYPESEVENLPMFAENRVHQRSSGNPYPNAVVIRTRKNEKTDKEYRAIILENEYLSLCILPELGGRIFSATDKTNGYDFFYRQHVIKPALIGALGSWISGGVEFNWPFHHRPSTFMPTDSYIERSTDGSVTVWLSEHEPFDRMKGMVGIRLEPGKSIFETRMRLFNRTPQRHSFLWWENTAVPVNPEYRIFFPPDVDHVYFHYRRNSMSFPVANGFYNGHNLGINTDITRHGSTKFSTSYFSAASEYDFFGGYDCKNNCGVVHYADHHISTGKKMFTWAYNQLASSWERALTDSDGPYAELMAGSYSNNQPDFSWLEPYETKCFSQFWYPISGLGIPTYANNNMAIRTEGCVLKIQPTRNIKDARIRVNSGNRCVLDVNADLSVGKVFTSTLSEALNPGWTISVESDGEKLLSYEDKTAAKAPREIKTLGDLPFAEDCKTAQAAYLAGVHIYQYRDPKADCELYFKRALELDPEYLPAFIALAEAYIHRCAYKDAKDMLVRAVNIATVLNGNPESGKIYYLLGLAHERLGETDAAYEAYYKAFWNADYASAAMTAIAALDGIRGNWRDMYEHACEAIAYNNRNLTASVYTAYAKIRVGCMAEAEGILTGIIKADPLCHFARYAEVSLGKRKPAEFYAELYSAPSQTCIDLYCELIRAGLKQEALDLLRGLINTGKASAMVYYLLGLDGRGHSIKCTFPFRDEEKYALEEAIKARPDDQFACYLLGCLLYNRKEYEKSEKLWNSCSGANALRAVAICLWRRGDRQGAIEKLHKAHHDEPGSEQLLFELVYLLNKDLRSVEEVEQIIQEADFDLKVARDDICVELAKAYNRCGCYKKALETLEGHNFIPCEGGENAVASQYIAALNGLAKEAFDDGKINEALELYQRAMQLPDNLGAGLWNDAPLAPSLYYEGLCLELLGRAKEARDCFSKITGFLTDYFSEMNLPELDIWKVKALIKLGDKAEAERLKSSVIAKWEKEMTRHDSGYFSTTPFFISYMDNPAEERKNFYNKLLLMIKKE